MIAPTPTQHRSSVALTLVSGAPSRSRFEVAAHQFVARHIGLLLRSSLAIVFFWFGVLKLVPGVSPAEHLAGETLRSLSFGWLQPSFTLPLLGGFEMAIGLALLLCPRARFTVPALLVHLAGTFTPLFLFPGETFQGFPVPTLVGQYILKNVVLAAAGLAILTSGPSE